MADGYLEFLTRGDQELPMADSYYAFVMLDGSINGAETRSDGTVPHGATAVSQDIYNTIVASPGQCRLVNGILTLTALPTPAPPDLPTFKLVALAQVDTAAEATRQLFLTPGAGQAMEYEATAAEATRALAQPPGATLDPADYPWLMAEISAFLSIGQIVSVLQMAQQVQQIMAGWTQAGAAIKEIRRTAKLQIAAASTFAQVHAVLDGLSWPSPS